MRGSGYVDVDGADDPSRYVRRLDAAAAAPATRALKARTFALLGPRPGGRLLDVGCGPGNDARALAALVAPGGSVVGVDASAVMIAEARRRASGTDLPVGFQQAGADRLPFPDASFDGCRAERLFQHLADPRGALAEMVRVARPGGRLAMLEPDYGTLAIDGADPDVTRRLLDCRREHFRSPDAGRKLSVWCRKLALDNVRAALVTRSWSAPHEPFLIRKYVAPALAAGRVSADETEAWLEQIRSAAREGAFRHSVTLFLVAARVPTAGDPSEARRTRG